MRQVVEDCCPSARSSGSTWRSTRTYGGDFQTGGTRGTDSRRSREPQSASLALAFAQLGQGQLPQATETYQKLGDDRRARALPWRRPVLATWPLYEGRFSDAARILEAGRSRGPGGQERRQGGREVRVARLRAPPARTEGRGRCGRRKGAGEQQGSEDPIPGGADVRRSGRTRQGQTADRRRWPRELQPSLRPTRKSSKATSR